MFVLLPGEVARGLDRNNSPRERTSPKEVNSTTNHLFSISFSIEGGKGYVIIGKTKENNPRAICSLVFPIASYTFGNFSIHLEVASDSFCFLINSSWLLVFILYVFSFFFSGFNLYWWKGIHFS